MSILSSTKLPGAAAGAVTGRAPGESQPPPPSRCSPATRAHLPAHHRSHQPAWGQAAVGMLAALEGSNGAGRSCPGRQSPPPARSTLLELPGYLPVSLEASSPPPPMETGSKPGWFLLWAWKRGRSLLGDNPEEHGAVLRTRRGDAAGSGARTWSRSRQEAESGSRQPCGCERTRAGQDPSLRLSLIPGAEVHLPGESLQAPSSCSGRRCTDAAQMCSLS